MRVSLTDFHQPFQHRATFNARLKTTGGRFNPQTCYLDFNPHLFARLTPDEQVGIIRHELCHYHLYRAKAGYRHRDADFKQLLKQVNGLRYAPAMPATTGWQYQCRHCGVMIVRRRRFNVSRYVCRRCRGPFILLGQVGASS